MGYDLIIIFLSSRLLGLIIAHKF